MHELLEDAVGCLLRDLLDFNAAVGANHDHRSLLDRSSTSPDTAAHIIESLLDEHALHDPTVRTGLVGTSVDRYLLSRLLCLVGRLDHRDAAALAAAAGMNLGLHHHRPAKLARDSTGILRREDNVTLRNRHAETEQVAWPGYSWIFMMCRARPGTRPSAARVAVGATYQSSPGRRMSIKRSPAKVQFIGSEPSMSSFRRVFSSSVGYQAPHRAHGTGTLRLSPPHLAGNLLVFAGQETFNEYRTA